MMTPPSAPILHQGDMPLLIHALLSEPACYDHTVEKIELVETHISWVLLTGDYAYKIKKPVDLGFLDFSTLPLRHQDCIDELRLNRRLAADIYLDVVAITGTPDAPRIDGAGEAFEYAVKMRQFPADAALDRLAERGVVQEAQIDALAARLAHFHLFECEPATADSPWGEPETIARPVEENFQILTQHLQLQGIDDLQRWCHAEHVRLEALMKERKASGRVRECHGDLHLANMAWVDGRLVIFDCLEFNPALRWIDVISEVAFCYMDLLHRSLPQLASRFLNAWLEVTGDYEGLALLRYYAVYRALVRAKVAFLRRNQDNAELASYLQLAERLAGFPSRFSPSLWITHGFSGSGKTTLSQQLLQQQGLIRLRSDVERKRLAGLDAAARGGAELGLYSESFGRRTYQHLAQLAGALLTSGWPVIVDAAFLERWQRDLFRDQALRLGADFRILDIQVSPEILRERISRRQVCGNDASEADLRVLQHQLETCQPLSSDELAVTQLV